ncbi:MAG: carbon-nitrogen hydrolase family protein, partial [Pseudomonadota bacterium]
TGDWVLEPETGGESLRIAEIDHRVVLEERQNMDVAGHYSRPDVTKLKVNRKRQATVKFSDQD